MLRAFLLLSIEYRSDSDVKGLCIVGRWTSSILRSKNTFNQIVVMKFCDSLRGDVTSLGGYARHHEPSRLTALAAA